MMRHEWPDGHRLLLVPSTLSTPTGPSVILIASTAFPLEECYSVQTPLPMADDLSRPTYASFSSRKPSGVIVVPAGCEPTLIGLDFFELHQNAKVPFGLVGSEDFETAAV